MIFGNLTSPELARLAAGRIAVLPLAAIEQHGDHLPVSTDTAICTELARRVESERPDRVVLLPTLWSGCSHHHLAFPGTLSISSETYVRVLTDLLESLLANGFSRIFLLNGHGGNQTPFAEALYRVALAHRQDDPAPWIAAQSYWKLADPEMRAADFMTTPALSHACEYETSLMLALRDGIDLTAARGARADRASAFYDPLGYGASRVVVAETFDQLSPNGALGSPEAATAEKGRRLFDLIVPAIVRFLDEFGGWPLRTREAA